MAYYAHEAAKLESKPIASSAKDVDLNSRSQTHLPTIIFKSPREHDTPIVVLQALNPLGVCMIIKEWLLDQINPYLSYEPQLLRIEPQELSLLESNRIGSLILLDSAAHIEDHEKKGRKFGIQICILALLMPSDPRVRFYYIQGPIAPLLVRLASETCISSNAREIAPKNDHLDKRLPDRHCRLYTWLQEAFLDAIKIPHHQDYANAMSMTDYAPFIRDSGDDPAIRRLEACDGLWATKDEPSDLSDDRYLLELHEAERCLASVMGLGCGEYLLVKRTFFRAFKEDVLHSEKKLDSRNSKVRTEYAHAQWLERVYEWKLTRAKRLVMGWRELGLLEEKRIRAWLRNGGVFEFADNYEDEE